LPSGTPTSLLVFVNSYSADISLLDTFENRLMYLSTASAHLYDGGLTSSVWLFFSAC